MKVAIIYNKKRMEITDVINVFGPPTKEHYSPKAVDRVAIALEKGGHNVKVKLYNNFKFNKRLLRHFVPRNDSKQTVFLSLRAKRSNLIL